MNGATRSRKGSRALRRRCPACKHLRKFCEPSGDTMGELHPRRPPWRQNAGGLLVCGWCIARESAEPTTEAR